MLYARLAGCARWFKRIWKEPLDHADATRLRTEQLSAVLRYTPVMMMANACNALVLMVAFWGTSSQASVLFWGATLFSVVGFICFRRCLPQRPKNPQRGDSTACAPPFSMRLRSAPVGRRCLFFSFRMLHRGRGFSLRA